GRCGRWGGWRRAPGWPTRDRWDRRGVGPRRPRRSPPGCARWPASDRWPRSGGHDEGDLDDVDAFAVLGRPLEREQHDLVARHVVGGKLDRLGEVARRSRPGGGRREELVDEHLAVAVDDLEVDGGLEGVGPPGHLERGADLVAWPRGLDEDRRGEVLVLAAELE